jgi:hypothetical protein
MYERDNFNKEFKADLEEAHKLESELKSLLENRCDCKVTTTQDKGSFSGYDMRLSFIDGTQPDLTFELKQDKRVMQTGNIAVEIGRELKDGTFRPTCINATTSDYFVYYYNHTFHFVETSKLKELIDKKQYTRIVNGGDSLRARVALIPREKFESIVTDKIRMEYKFINKNG